jgi:hypothetical protein
MVEAISPDETTVEPYLCIWTGGGDGAVEGAQVKVVLGSWHAQGGHGIDG